jgi:Zn-dependent protease/CBS domain-containing protein
MMGRGFHLTRIAGIDVYLDWSLLIIVTLVTAMLALGVFPQWHPDWSLMTIWTTALAAAVLLLLSVLIHEMSHAVVGRAQGIDIRRITLFVFGGMAHLREEPHAWRSEFWMAIVGPITSLVLGVVCIVLALAIGGPLEVDPEEPQRTFAQFGPVSTLLLWLGPVNIVLAVFNLVPGFPLDGGRVLRAALWGATGDLHLATRWASYGGQAFAWLLIGSGIGMALGLHVPLLGTGLVPGLWLALIGWFLNNAAVMAYQQLLLRESLDDVPVAQLMLTDVPAVGADMSLSTLVDDYMMPTHERAFPVMKNEALAGLICLQDVSKIPRAKWDMTRVADVMTSTENLATIGPEESSSRAMMTLSQRGVNQLPVIERGRVRGLIRREDILKWLTLYGDPALRR